jgi:hypothetical protein
MFELKTVISPVSKFSSVPPLAAPSLADIIVLNIGIFCFPIYYINVILTAP